MTILQSQIDDAPKQLCIDLPPEWEHRSSEVIGRPLDEEQPPNADQARPRPARPRPERAALNGPTG